MGINLCFQISIYRDIQLILRFLMCNNTAEVFPFGFLSNLLLFQKGTQVIVAGTYTDKKRSPVSNSIVKLRIQCKLNEIGIPDK